MHQDILLLRDNGQLGKLYSKARLILINLVYNDVGNCLSNAFNIFYPFTFVLETNGRSM